MSTRGRNKRQKEKRTLHSFLKAVTVELDGDSKLMSSTTKSDVAPVQNNDCIELSSDDDIEVTEEHIRDQSVVCVGAFMPPTPQKENNDIQVVGQKTSNTANQGFCNIRSESSSSKIKCSICMDSDDDIKSSGKHLCSTICGHIFCNECITAALKVNHLCPQCRKKLSVKQYHPLYI